MPSGSARPVRGLWQRLLGRPASESGRLRQGPAATGGAIAAGGGYVAFAPDKAALAFAQEVYRGLNLRTKLDDVLETLAEHPMRRNGPRAGHTQCCSPDIPARQHRGAFALSRATSSPLRSAMPPPPSCRDLVMLEDQSDLGRFLQAPRKD